MEAVIRLFQNIEDCEKTFSKFNGSTNELDVAIANDLRVKVN